MRAFLSACLCIAVSVAAQGFDADGAETLAPAAPVEKDSAATPPASAPAKTDSVDPAPPVAPPAIKTDSVASSLPASVDASAPPRPAAPMAPVAKPPAGAFAIGERADTTRTVRGPVRQIAIGLDTAGSSRDHRSTWAAVGLTLLLPGSGHRYLGHRTGAAVWMTTDLLLWSGVAVSWQMGRLYIQDATEIANRHAGASLGSDPDIELLETMRDWRSRRPVGGRRDSYDEALIQQGLPTDSRFPQDAAHDWDWGSPENPENNRHIASFEDALKGYRTSRIALTYAAGGLLVSRAIAVADILRIRRKSASRAGIHALVIPRFDGAQGIVAYRF